MTVTVLILLVAGVISGDVAAPLVGDMRLRAVGAAAAAEGGGAPLSAGDAVGVAPEVGAGTAPPRALQVVRMVPRGFAPDSSMTEAAVRATVARASAYWSQQTLGRISFRVTAVSEWQRAQVGCEDVPALWAEAAQSVSWAGAPRAHLLVVAPRDAGELSTGCNFGYGSLGSLEAGGFTYVTDLYPQLLAHELGHNFGLGHAGALDCPRRQDGSWNGSAWSDGCRARAYDDLYDVMGYSGEGFGGGNLGAVALDRLGVDPGGVRTVRASEQGVRLVGLSRMGEGVRVVRIEVPGEPVYYLEYRNGEGRDASVTGGAWRVPVGVRVLREAPGGGSLELDTSPGGRRYDREMSPGRSFTSRSGAIRVTVRSLDVGAAVLDIVVDAR